MPLRTQPAPLRTSTILYCGRWVECVRFYREMLRFRVTHENDWFVEFELTGNSRIAIADARRASVKSAGGKGITLSFQVEDIDATRRFLRDATVEVSEIKAIWDSRSFFVYDPEGHRIEFWA